MVGGCERLRLGEITERAMLDSAFCEQLKADPVTVCRENGLDIPLGCKVEILQNTENLTHFVIPLTPLDEDLHVHELGPNASKVEVALYLMTQIDCEEGLCERLEADPIETLASLGVDLPDHLDVKVFVDTEQHRFLVLPFMGNGGCCQLPRGGRCCND